MGIPVSGSHFCTPFSALVEDQCTGPLRPFGAPQNTILFHMTTPALMYWGEKPLPGIRYVSLRMSSCRIVSRQSHVSLFRNVL